ncbi:MAG: GYD domain-containing protein [Acidimicrobiia bacterium]
MATFISLISYTEQGIANIKDSPKRLDQAREGFEAMGVTLKEVYLTLGAYDVVIVIEAPDAATAARALLTIGSMGNVSTTTLTAFTEDEYRAIIAGLP